MYSINYLSTNSIDLFSGVPVTGTNAQLSVFTLPDGDLVGIETVDLLRDIYCGLRTPKEPMLNQRSLEASLQPKKYEWHLWHCSISIFCYSRKQ